MTFLDRLRALLPPSVPGTDAEEADARRNGLAMLVSLAIAVVLWFTFSMRETYTLAVTMPVEVVGLPVGQALRAAPPERVRVQLQGEGWDLLALSRGTPTVRLRADGPAVDVLAALAESGLPAGVRAQAASPRTIELLLDERVERTVPIVLDARLRTTAPFSLLTPPRLAPDSVRVSGARAVVDRLTAWPTEPLVRQDVRRSFAETVGLRDTLVALVARSATSTAVTVTVAEFTEGERFLPVVVENAPPGVTSVRFVPDRVRVTYRVPIEGLAYDRAETAADFRAIVDFQAILRDTTAGTVPVTLRLPEGLDLRDVRAAPSRVEYFLRRD